jgi:hypothetical protein
MPSSRIIPSEFWTLLKKSTVSKIAVSKHLIDGSERSYGVFYEAIDSQLMSEPANKFEAKL